MAEIVFVTGGTRSGKSSFAIKLAEQNSDSPVYLATARIWDDDFKERVKRHQDDRDKKWHTIEEEKRIDKLHIGGETVVLDCITLWLTNIFHDNQYNLDKSLAEAKKIWDSFIRQDFELIAVSNEVGLGIHPENEIARKFTDLQGFINQYIAACSAHTYLIVSGIPIKIK